MTRREINIALVSGISGAVACLIVWMSVSAFNSPAGMNRPEPEEGGQRIAQSQTAAQPIARIDPVPTPPEIRQTAAPVAPPQLADIYAVTDALRGKDIAAQDAAIVQIYIWLDADYLPIEIWSTWMLDLRIAGRHQDIANLSLQAMIGSVRQPFNDAISTVVSFRAEALLALNKPQEALVAAKQYYNVCEFANTPKAIDLIGQCLIKLHPEDTDIVRRFRSEQGNASSAVGSVAPSPTLGQVKIDAAPFSDAIKSFSGKTQFAERACYANLLLMADRGADAEKVYREMYALGNNADDLKLAAEGVARALCAADGNIARANAWLVAVQKQ